MKLIVLSLVVLATVVVDSAFLPTDHSANVDEYNCSANESFQECGRPAICDLTCKNMDQPNPTCPPICVRRCICDWGFVRTEDGKCMDRNECPVEGDN
ncbi:hypothetical protein HA402_005878 [Bradysia odoriphaga]|nr:hypothetical protein HA402_005878 [Bradysia odoriphaga]